jgi:hypothetical protein
MEVSLRTELAALGRPMVELPALTGEVDEPAVRQLAAALRTAL